MTDVILPIHTTTEGIDVVSTLDFARGLHIQHASLIKTIREHQEAIEKGFGRVGFEIVPLVTAGGTQQVTTAKLTEDQALFVGTLTRNSERVVEFKTVLIRSFSEARRRLRMATYLPSYQIEDPILRAHQWIEEQKQLKALTEENAQLKPKAEYAQQVLLSETKLTTTVVASQLGMSAIKLNKLLAVLKIQRKQSGTWVLYAKYAGQGYADLRTYPYTDSQGKSQTSHLLVWTELGREFIIGKLPPSSISSVTAPIATTPVSSLFAAQELPTA